MNDLNGTPARKTDRLLGVRRKKKKSAKLRPVNADQDYLKKLNLCYAAFKGACTLQSFVA